MLDRHIPGMGDYSPPDGPDEEKAGEEALIAAKCMAGGELVINLYEIAKTEHTVFFQSIDEDPNAFTFGEYVGPWYEIYVSARNAFNDGRQLQKQRKQGEPQNA